MAELSLFCPTVVTLEGSTANVEVQRRILCRTGSAVPANTPIDINSPGVGWTIIGDVVTFASSDDFVELTKVYRGGQLLLNAKNSDTNFDVYFVSADSTLAFEDTIRKNEVLQVWKFESAP